MSEPPITAVLRFYFPSWQPPEDRYEWNQTLCPAHDEDHPSCAVSYEHDAIRCHACGFRGNVISIIRRQEGVNSAEAANRAAEILGRRYEPVSQRITRKPSRRVFGKPAEAAADGIGSVSTRVRSRTAPWA